MNKAVLSSLLAQHPLIIRSDSSSRAPFRLAQICAAYALNCKTIAPTDLLRHPAAVDSSDNSNDSDVNVLIVKDLHAAHRNVQVQVIEVLKKRAAQRREPFLLIALLPTSVVSRPYLTAHLNDRFLFAYTQHDPEDGLHHDADDDVDDDTDTDADAETLSKDDIARLQKDVAHVRTSAEMQRYTHDIVTFLRLNRACGGGVSAMATRQLGLLSRVHAVLDGVAFVTPAHVKNAARKIYLHRLVIVRAEDERSMQWGSERAAVREALAGATPESVVEDVLRTVACPF